MTPFGWVLVVALGLTMLAWVALAIPGWRAVRPRRLRPGSGRAGRRPFRGRGARTARPGPQTRGGR